MMKNNYRFACPGSIPLSSNFIWEPPFTSLSPCGTDDFNPFLQVQTWSGGPGPAHQQIPLF